MDRIALIQFLLLAFALPAQYFIVEYWSFNTAERSQALKKLVFVLLKIKFKFNLCFFLKV